MFIGLLTDLVNVSYHTKCELLSNHKSVTQPTLINLHCNKYSQKLNHYPLAVK